MATVVRRLTLVGLVIIGSLGFPSDASSQGGVKNPAATAAFLYNCALFVEWPTGTAESGDFVIGISDAPGSMVSQVMAAMIGRKIKGRTVRVRSVKPEDDLAAYRIVFSSGDSKSTAALMGRIGDLPVLTVGDRDGFLSEGGLVHVSLDDERFQFEVDLARAQRAGLKFSSKMLGLARPAKAQ